MVHPEQSLSNADEPSVSHSSSSCASPAEANAATSQSTKMSSKNDLPSTSSPNSPLNSNEPRSARKMATATEIHSNAALKKVVPDVFDRFVDVFDHVTQKSCNSLMCKTCRLLIKKNVLLVSSHLCKQRDVERHVSLPVTGKLLFRAKPKNRATPIWDEFEEVFEPTSGTLLGYARCKRCMDIIKTSDPKSIPAVLRRHLPSCTHGPFHPSLMVTPSGLTSSTQSKSSTASNHSNDSGDLSVSNLPSSAASTPSASATAMPNDRSRRVRDQIVAQPPVAVHPRIPSSEKQQIINRLLAAQSQLAATSSITIVPISGGSGASSPAPPNGTAVEQSTQLIQQMAQQVAQHHHQQQQQQQQLHAPKANPQINKAMAAKALALAAAAAAKSNGMLANGSNGTNSAQNNKIVQLKSEFRKRCIDFCCTELISLETIASDSFRRLGQSLMSLGAQSSKPQNLPDTSQLYTQLHAQCSAVRAQIKAELQNELIRGTGAALICDAQDDVCILSAMYVNSNYQLIETVLSATSTCNDVNGLIKANLDLYGLKEPDLLNKITFVSRGGVFDGVDVSLPSIAHQLDQIVESSIFFDDAYTEMIENCRIICSELGVEIQTEESVESVEWILKFELMRQVLENQDKFELNNSTFNLHLLRFMVDLLGPFKNASIELRLCNNRPTICHVLLWYYKILKALQLEPPTDDPDLDEADRKYMQQMKRTLRKNVESNFQLHTLHKVAVFLWPNFRTLKMLSQVERTQLHKEIRHIIETKFPDLKANLPPRPESPLSKKARTDFADWEEDSSEINQQDEIERYVNAPLPACNEVTLLSWWRDHQTDFPQLAHLARWLFAIPASATTLERHKLNTTSKVDDELLFLHCNLYA